MGPARKNEKKALKEGVLLEMFENRILSGGSKRKVRQVVSDSVFPLSGWSTGLDHLEMPPEGFLPYC